MTLEPLFVLEALLTCVDEVKLVKLSDFDAEELPPGVLDCDLVVLEYRTVEKPTLEG